MIKLDDTELAQMHALANASDQPISAMLRKWLAERYGARFGDAPPPETRTKFGDTVRPTKS